MADLVIFDVCDTLYRENTTAGFVRHFHRLRGNRRYRLQERMLRSKASPFFYLAAAAERWLGVEFVRSRQIASLSGASRAELAEAATNYRDRILPGLVNSPVHQRLKEHVASGDRVILVSASLDVVIGAVAASLGVEFRASTLGFDGDTCAGRLAADLSGAKTTVAEALLSQAPAGTKLHVYTDNLSDSGLLKMADRPTVIIPAGRTRSRWGSFDAAFVEL